VEFQRTASVSHSHDKFIWRCSLSTHGRCYEHGNETCYQFKTGNFLTKWLPASLEGPWAKKWTLQSLKTTPVKGFCDGFDKPSGYKTGNLLNEVLLAPEEALGSTKFSVIFNSGNSWCHFYNPRTTPSGWPCFNGRMEDDVKCYWVRGWSFTHARALWLVQ
jgi:hypothetical protein